LAWECGACNDITAGTKTLEINARLEQQLKRRSSLSFNDLVLIGFVKKIGFNASAFIYGGATPNKRIVFKINIKRLVIFFHVLYSQGSR